jgi:Tfp pilus assembly protein PilF
MIFVRGKKQAHGPLKAYMVLIDRCIEERRWDIAEIFINRALVHDANNIGLLLKRADVEERLGKRDKAIQTYQRVMALSSWKVQNPDFQRASRKIRLIADPGLAGQLAD